MPTSFLPTHGRTTPEIFGFQVFFVINIKSYSDFLIYYKETLLQMCRYQIVFLKMCKENEKKPMRIEDWGKAFGEERYRKELCDIMVKLKNTYMEIIDNQVEEKIKQEIKLK